MTLSLCNWGVSALIFICMYLLSFYYFDSAVVSTPQLTIQPSLVAIKDRYLQSFV